MGSEDGLEAVSKIDCKADLTIKKLRAGYKTSAILYASRVFMVNVEIIMDVIVKW